MSLRSHLIFVRQTLANSSEQFSAHNCVTVKYTFTVETDELWETSAFVSSLLDDTHPVVKTRIRIAKISG